MRTGFVERELAKKETHLVQLSSYGLPGLHESRIGALGIDAFAQHRLFVAHECDDFPIRNPCEYLGSTEFTSALYVDGSEGSLDQPLRVAYLRDVPKSKMGSGVASGYRGSARKVDDASKRPRLGEAE